MRHYGWHSVQCSEMQTLGINLLGVGATDKGCRKGYPYWAYLLVFTDCGSYFSTTVLGMKWEIGFFPILFQIEVRFVIIWIIIGWTKQSCWVIPIPVPIQSERNVVSILNASIELHWSIFYCFILPSHYDILRAGRANCFLEIRENNSMLMISKDIY